MEIGVGGVGSGGGGLVGWEIHGFRTVEDLDINGTRNEARSRWLQPNEIHAILSNSSYFRINSKPVNLPQSGTMLLFDRKTLRHFRKDGHNWKKKKDGKTVKEAHEHLKVGGVERIHVYYAHGEDKPNFVRRCYWLLDKAMEHIVLVHYRETQEEGSPVTPKLSYSGSELSDRSSSQLVLEEINSEYDHAGTNGQLGTLNLQQFSHEASNFKNNMSYSTNLQAEAFTLQISEELSKSSMDNFFPQAMTGQLGVNEQNAISKTQTGASGITLENSLGDGLQAQDSFGRWMNDIMINASEPLEVPSSESLELTVHNSSSSPSMPDPRTFIPQPIFSIIDMSPTWAFATEETKILVIGFFHEEYQHLANSPLYCICGEESIPVEAVQAGVFRCLIPPHGPGLVNFYLSIDQSSPVSQVLSFEVRSPVYKNVVSTEEDSNWEDCQFQIRLARLLFSTSKSLDIFSCGSSKFSTKDATKFVLKTSAIDVSSWAYLIELITNGKMLLTQAKESLLELTLKNKLNEWLLERLMYGDSITERDEQGQGVLHLCAILGYSWAVYPFTLSGLSLDFRDKFGWTALHWAAYYGREQMVAALLSAGAKPNLVTDPTPENPGGCTPGDIAIVKGYEGLAAFLSEKALVQQFKDMKLAGHASGSLETAASQDPSANEEENSLHDALAASMMAADAAARIQAAFREHSFKLRTKAIESSNPEMEARNIIAAMKIQHAFRNYEGRKKMAAAAHIQGRYRTWKLRTEFLNKRRHAIRIQAAFRGFQTRKQYKTILWSVGFLEKAILRWRLKRKGLRGLHVGPTEPITSQHQGNVTDEDFFRASRQQAEERVERAVVRVQAIFRSKKAQVEYRRMKLTHIQAKINYDETVRYDSYLE